VLIVDTHRAHDRREEILGLAPDGAVVDSQFSDSDIDLADIVKSFHKHLPGLPLVVCSILWNSEAGVDVEIKEFTAGKFALQAFFGGSLDVAVSGEVPVALSTLQGNKFRVLAQVVERTINECRVVARKEAGLDTPEKYFGAKKRKLATSFGGGPEFFTHSFLNKHGIGFSQVEIISQRPEDMPAALKSGSVDAISIFDPQARIAERLMGAEGITFADADIYSELYVVNVMQTTIDNRRDELLAFLQGLHDASHYIEENPEQSKQVLIRYTKLDRPVVDDIWKNFVFKAAINRLFADYTTAQARWAVPSGFPSFPRSAWERGKGGIKGYPGLGWRAVSGQPRNGS
jgi:ABC-type nitrate/sulfonate/bicarbonate transport system substrate-binding protein